MTITEALTWTDHTFRCTRGCGRLARAAQEYIDLGRQSADETEAEIVAQFDFCLKCLDGVEHEGEQVEEGYQPLLGGRPFAKVEDLGYPICERCGTVVTDDMTIEFAPYCSARCQWQDAFKDEPTLAERYEAMTEPREFVPLRSRIVSRLPIEDTAYAGMCFGSVGVKDEPICDGPDVRLVRAKAPAVPFEQGDGWFTTHWCADCRAQALADGYVIADVEP